MSTMEAAVFEKVGSPLQIMDVPVPTLAEDEVLVKTMSCGICGTDLHIMKGFGYIPKLPHIPGHEPSGIVEKVGSAVTGFKPGDRVVPYLFITCGQCWYCKKGRDSMCSNLKGLIGVTVNGALAEYFKAPARNLFKLPDNVPFEIGALSADAVITSVHAVYDRANVGEAKLAGIIGMGGVGQIVLQLLKNLGLTVVAISRSEQKLRASKELGADHAFQGGSESLGVQVKTLNPDGLDVVFDCVGSEESMRDAVVITKRCGRIVMIGEEKALFPADSTRIAQSELELVGSRNGTRKNMQLGLDLLGQGKIRPIVSDIFDLNHANDALDKVRTGAAGRVVVNVALDAHK